MAYRPSNEDYIMIDRELHSMISIISEKYNIPVQDLNNIKNKLDCQCIGNIWNTGNPIRCSRKKINDNDKYCRVHQMQLDKYGHLKYGNYNGSNNYITPDFDIDDYDSIECDTVVYKEEEYYLDDNKNIFKMIDKENSIVETIKNDEIKKIILENI